MDAGHETGVSFDDQLGAMVQAREDGLIASVGLSNVSREPPARAGHDANRLRAEPAERVDRASPPVLQECVARGKAFVPFFPLGSAFDASKPVLSHPGVTSTAQRVGFTASQVALAWLLALSPNILLIPGTSSLATSTRTCASPRSSLTPRHWWRWTPRSSSYSSALFQPRKRLRCFRRRAVR